jgi:hypothetical protein
MHSQKFSSGFIVALFLFLGMVALDARATASTTIPPGNWVRISAFTNQPLANADVAIFRTNGRLLFARANVTNARGIYPAHVEHLPPDFRVFVIWDSHWQANWSGLLSLGLVVLSADVRNYNPSNDIVYVNPVTTMVTALLLGRPQLELEEAQAQVRHFLGMPANASLGAALREGERFHPAYFSASAFLKEANESGGVLTFMESLLNQILHSPGTVHSFPYTVLQSGSGSGGIANFVAEKLASGALSWAAGQGLGWVAQSAGLTTPGATAAQIAQLQASLDELQSSVDQLSKQLAQATQQILNELTKTQYNTIATQAVALAAKVNVAADNLSYLADGCPPYPEDGSTDSVGSVSADWCASQSALVRSQLSDIEINGSYETLANWLLDTQAVGFKGMIHLFSQSAGQSVPFFRPADSGRVQNMFDYWDAVETQAANLKTELWHLNGNQNNPGGKKQITDFWGNPELDPPTTGNFQATHAAELQLMFPAVPTGTVVDTKTRAMWATGLPMLQPYMDIDGNTFYTCPFDYYGSGGPYGLTGGPSFGMSFAGLPGWTSPSQPVLQAFIDGWNGNASNPMNWLIAQSKATAPDMPTSDGFFNVLGCSQGGYYFVWTTTNQGSSNPNFYSPYAVIDMRNGSIPAKNTYPYGQSNWLMLTRPLAQNEQYYWYP